MSEEKPNLGLKYVLDCLQRSSENSSVWPVYPAEAGAILSEITRLRKELEDLRRERAAVMAWLRKWGGDCEDAAETIERGEHRREEER